MTYTKYHTDAIVLASTDRGEADVVYTLLTRDAGILYASAQGIRKIGSKLRAGLQVGTLGSFSFVRGKSSWRITYSKPYILAGTILAQDKILNAIFGRLSRLVRKLLPKEEAEERLFDVFAHALYFISVYELSEDEKENLEALLAMRVLHVLGYLGMSRRFAYLLSSPFVSDVFLAEAARVRKGAIAHINRALREL